MNARHSGGSGVRDRLLRLADDRVLSYRVQGRAKGKPLLFFHGWPGSRLLNHPDLSIWERLGIMLVTADRPGYGLSSRAPGRTVADWTSDVAAVADAEGIDRFTVAGVSGGGPFALACAALLPDRVEALVLAAGLGPVYLPEVRRAVDPVMRFGFFLADASPQTLALALSPFRFLLTRRPERLYDLIARSLPWVEGRVLRMPEVRSMVLADACESFRQGVYGAVDDLAAFVTPWGFAPDQVRVPTYLWHGTDDGIVPVDHARLFAASIPCCTTSFVPGGGHFSLFSDLERLMSFVSPESPE